MRTTTAVGLLVASAVLFLGGVPSGAAAAPTCASPTWEFTVDGNVTVDVEWCEGAHFENRSVVTHEHAEERTVQVNRNATTAFNNRILLHELSHVLGYGHGDGGVASPSFADATTCGLDPVTKRVARSFEGYVYLDWDLADVLFVIDEWAAGRTDTAHVVYGIEQWSTESGCEDVYYASDFGGFGTGGAGRITENAGHFYGRPVEAR